MSEELTLWRISNYASLDGVGGLYVSGRWHTKGHPIIYCSEDPSTALLETLVHLEIDAEDRPENFQVLKIQSTRAVSLERLESSFFRAGWQDDIPRTRAAGGRWLSAGKTLLLEVPSVLVPERRNYLVNPLHPEMKSLRIAAVYSHPFDSRFFKR